MQRDLRFHNMFLIATKNTHEPIQAALGRERSIIVCCMLQLHANLIHVQALTFLMMILHIISWSTTYTIVLISLTFFYTFRCSHVDRPWATFTLSLRENLCVSIGWWCRSLLCRSKNFRYATISAHHRQDSTSIRCHRLWKNFVVIKGFLTWNKWPS